MSAKGNFSEKNANESCQHLQNLGRGEGRRVELHGMPEASATESVTLLLFILFLWLCGMQELSSLTRDRTHVWSPNH